MVIAAIQKHIHAWAQRKGWYQSPREAGTYHMLMVSELAEATEAVRKGEPALHYGEIDPPMREELAVHHGVRVVTMPNGKQYAAAPSAALEKMKPEGELTELADCVIRILDYCEYKGYDLEVAIAAKMEYNETRPERHGGKAY